MLPPTVRPRGATRSAAAISVPALSMLLMLAPTSARGQAWVPPAGAGSMSFVVQAIDNAGHRLDDGSLLPDGKSSNVGLYVEGDYAVTDRISLSVGITLRLRQGPAGQARVRRTCPWTAAAAGKAVAGLRVPAASIS